MSFIQNLFPDRSHNKLEAIRSKIIKNDTIYYEVKWRGLPESLNTIETIENIKDYQDFVAEFEKKLYKKRKNRKRSLLNPESIGTKDVIVIDDEEDNFGQNLVTKSAVTSRDKDYDRFDWEEGELHKSHELSQFFESHLKKSNEKIKHCFLIDEVEGLQGGKNDRNIEKEELMRSKEEESVKDQFRKNELLILNQGKTQRDQKKPTVSFEKNENLNEITRKSSSHEMLLKEYKLKIDDITKEYQINNDVESEKSLEKSKTIAKPQENIPILSFESCVNTIFKEKNEKKEDIPKKSKESLNNSNQKRENSEKKLERNDSKVSKNASKHQEHSKSHEKHHYLRHNPRKRSRSPSKSHHSREKARRNPKNSQNNSGHSHKPEEKMTKNIKKHEKTHDLSKSLHTHSKKIQKDSQGVSNYYRKKYQYSRKPDSYTHSSKNRHSSSLALTHSKSISPEYSSLKEFESRFFSQEKETKTIDEIQKEPPTRFLFDVEETKTTESQIEPERILKPLESKLFLEEKEPQTCQNGSLLEGNVKAESQAQIEQIEPERILKPLSKLFLEEKEPHICQNASLLEEKAEPANQQVSEEEIKSFLQEINGSKGVDITKEFKIEGLRIGNLKKDKINKVNALIVEKEDRKHLFGEVSWQVRKNKDHMGTTILPFDEIMKTAPKETAWFFVKLLGEEIRNNLF